MEDKIKRTKDADIHIRCYPEDKMFATSIHLAILNFWLLNKLMRDPKGRKKHLVRRVDQLVSGHIFVSGIVANDGFKAYKDPCNLRHIEWKNPWDPSIASHQDVFQLMDEGLLTYDKHLENYRDVISHLPKKLTLNHDYSESYYRSLNQFLEEVGDLSYDSGLPL